MFEGFKLRMAQVSYTIHQTSKCRKRIIKPPILTRIVLIRKERKLNRVEVSAVADSSLTKQRPRKLQIMN